MRTMRKMSLTMGACTMLLWSGTALAVFTPTPQQKCDNARVTAWKAYVSCVEAAVAKDAKGVTFDEFAAFAKCRHAYFKKWTKLSSTLSLHPSTCNNNRYTDNGDQTVTDRLTGLVWEKKTNKDVSINFSDPQDADNFYTWSGTIPSQVNKESGSAFDDFLDLTNAGPLGGAAGWRLPTLAELQTIVLDFPCTGAGLGPKCSCPSSPCVDANLDPATTQSNVSYWSATGYVPDPARAWDVNFFNGSVNPLNKTSYRYVRAVRGGL